MSNLEDWPEDYYLLDDEDLHLRLEDFLEYEEQEPSDDID